MGYLLILTTSSKTANFLMFDLGEHLNPDALIHKKLIKDLKIQP